ncbi:MAG: type II toxin-antitoxin system HipA family toxin [Frankiaceae bacterium]|nr:type II toxin-antitoxin system HipA family toxin [Arenimonas sp.]
MAGVLDVRLFGRHIGTVAIEGALRSPEDWRFRYDQAYLQSESPTPLSVMLPLRDAGFSGAIVSNWFGNLLPEGVVRETIERRLRLPPRDDFAFLEAIGGECAGAVSVGPQLAPAGGNTQAQDDLETLIAQQGEGAGEGAWAALGAPRRLSLAGAQDKIAVIRQSNGRLALPAPGAVSTHILKPDSLRLRGLRDLEALGLRLARAMGLNAVTVEMMQVGGREALLVERYDRWYGSDGSAQRLHQEDFCQALGYPAGLKYESQGGPSLADCAALVRTRLRLGPFALQHFLDWVVFSAIIGNADAHAKNLSLLTTPDSKRQLAPFYDLVPILTLPESMIDRAPALRIGSARRIDAVSSDDWREFARATGYAPRFVLARVDEMAGQVLAMIDAVARQLVDEGADERRLQAALSAITTNARQQRH